MPVLKGLQEEFGKKEVHAVVKKVIDEMYIQYGADWAANTPGKTTDKMKAAVDMFAEAQEGTAIDIEEIKRTDSEYQFDITRCGYADLYKKLGEPELGALLVCGVDFPMAEGYNAGVKLNRPKTIMRGDDKCIFRYTIEK